MLKRRMTVSAACLAGSLMAWAALPAVAGTPATLRVEYTFDRLTPVTIDPPTATTGDLTGRSHLLTLSGNYAAVTGPTSPAVRFSPISRAATPHKADLNPVGREFAVTVVFRIAGDTSGISDTPNMAQKGFYGDVGQWKMQLKPDVASVQCRFKGTLDARLITSPVTGVDDGVWHTATCWRSGNQVGVTVDATDTAVTSSVGDIANSRQMLIGAKSLSSAADQFAGEIDYVAMAVGDGAAAVSRAGAVSR
ncbi:MAG: hypothetical protein LH630_01635 [Actinomycetia bacterium]|nr:hypothetical protein [Actinomycetes bacterium]